MRTQGSAPATSGMIRRFNRDTVWLATGVLVTVIWIAVVAIASVQLFGLLKDGFRKGTDGRILRQTDARS